MKVSLHAAQAFQTPLAGRGNAVVFPCTAFAIRTWRVGVDDDVGEAASSHLHGHTDGHTVVKVLGQHARHVDL